MHILVVLILCILPLDAFAEMDLPQIELTPAVPSDIDRGLTHQQAKAYCDSIGTRLPTPKELALYINQHGGFFEIRETSFPGIDVSDERVQLELKKLDHEYIPIYLEISSGKTGIDFYITGENYIAPPAFGAWIWTSQENTIIGHHNSFYGMYGRSGGIVNPMPGASLLGVYRCLKP